MKTVNIAKDIVFLCKKHGYEYNNTKVQKLLYLFVGFCLMNNLNEIEKIDEIPRIWPYGPVFPIVHKAYDEHIANSCLDNVREVKNEQMKVILEKTVEQWGIVPASKLSAWSHEPDSPWSYYVQEGKKWNTPMDLLTIKVYFARRVMNVV